MGIKRIDRKALDAWVDTLVGMGRVYGVQSRQDEKFAFAPVKRGGDLVLDYDVTVLPPKKYFQPQREVLSTFKVKKVEFTSVVEEDPFVVFGVHPYDMAAISQMDKVFTMDHCDIHYLARREAATIVVLDVVRPSANGFAGCMGHATMEGQNGHDVLVTPLPGNQFLVDARTKKGDAICEPLAGAPAAGEKDLETRKAAWARNREALSKNRLKVSPEELPALLEKSKDHPVWEEKAALCYSCGSCNFVCPTCYCFDVQDEVSWDLDTGERVRTWDGCMLHDFAAVAGGHNFRQKPSWRYRHRYYRKGKYAYEIYGEVGCVGCGRCTTACTAGIANPVEIFNRLAEGSK